MYDGQILLEYTEISHLNVYLKVEIPIENVTNHVKNKTRSRHL